MLCHGTATHFVAVILPEGLKRQSRQQVHLSIDLARCRETTRGFAPDGAGAGPATAGHVPKFRAQ